MRKRTGLDAVEMAAKARAGAPTQPQGKGGSMTTAIVLPTQTHELLRAVAFKRATRQGGRISVSALIVELIEKSRAALEGELED